jgi:hypothetical protein
MDFKLLLRKTLSEIATLSRTYRDFENSIRRIGITPDELHELGIKYIVTHEHDLGTSFLFYNNEDEAKASLLNWYNGRLNKNRKSTRFVARVLLSLAMRGELQPLRY